MLIGILLTVAGCTGSSSSQPHREVTVAVNGGTPAMRAQARGILRRMRSTPIVRVQFQRPPFQYAQYARDDHPAWVTVTVQAPGYATQQQAAATSWALGFADIFERAYQAGVPAGGYRLLGTSEQRTWHGQMHYVGGGVSAVPSWAHANRTADGVAHTVREAAGRAGFGVSSLTVFPLDRFGAATVLSVDTHHDFASRLNAFGAAMGRLGYATDGVDWQLRDRCGNVVASVAGGTYVNPRWECPNPWSQGPVMLGDGCRQQAAAQPACGAA